MIKKLSLFSLVLLCCSTLIETRETEEIVKNKPNDSHLTNNQIKKITSKQNKDFKTNKINQYPNPLKLPKKLQGKVLFTADDKNQLKEHYTAPKKVEFAISHLLDISQVPKGEPGIMRIDSVDFLEKSIRYRDNKLRPKIIRFIEEFTHLSLPSDMDKQGRKFIVGDQIELLEILAFNQPREFLYLKQRTTNEKVLKMMKLVEHHANRNQ